jgi:hypothetical protein
MDDETNAQEVIVPILADSLTIMNFVVPKDFADRISLHAMKLVEAFDNHPSGQDMDPNNKQMQAMSFIIQSAFDNYLNETQEHWDDDSLPGITDFE